MQVVKKVIKHFIWQDWQDTLIFWFCAPAAVIGLYMLVGHWDGLALSQFGR